MEGAPAHHCFDRPSASPRMKLLLIRHAETEHNIAGLLAGVTDSKLTHHGVMQTQRLAKYLVKDRNFQFTHVYASDLTRAFMTADEICKAQNEAQNAIAPIESTKLELLREQDFGSLELVSWSSRRDSHAVNPSVPNHNNPSFKAKETGEAMKGRANSFLDDFITPLLVVDDSHEMCIAITSHGIFLGTLWRSILSRLSNENIILDKDLAVVNGNRLSHLRPGWSNTGFVEIELKSSPPSEALPVHKPVTSTRSVSPTAVSNKESSKIGALGIHTPPAQEELKNVLPTSPKDRPANLINENPSDTTSTLPWSNVVLTIKVINGKDHLLHFKRARGGLGSMAYDKRQTKLEGFFKKTKTESGAHDYHLRSKQEPT